MTISRGNARETVPDDHGSPFDALRSLNRKSQNAAPSMIVWVRVSSISGLNPCTSAKSRSHDKLPPRSSSPSASIHFRVTATRDVERQLLWRLLEHVDLESPVFAPSVKALGKGLQGLIAELLRQLASTLSGQVANQPAHYLQRSLLADFGCERPHQRPDDPRLDFALLVRAAMSELRVS